LIAWEQIYNPRFSSARSQGDHRRMGIRNRSDDVGVASQWMLTDCFESPFGRRVLNNRKQLALVCHVQEIES
jgi:hypothetical protein